MILRPDETLGAWIAFAMHSLTNAFTEVLRHECERLEKPYTVTPPQWATLAWIDAERALSVGALARKLGIDDSVATGLVKRLELNGLIERAHDRADRRIVWLSLTTEGGEIVQRLNPAVVAFNDQGFYGFSPEQRQVLREQLRQAVSNVAPKTRPGRNDRAKVDQHTRPERKTSASHVDDL
jgi:DNA-binding MarR family transcriptional regulator